MLHSPSDPRFLRKVRELLQGEECAAYCFNLRSPGVPEDFLRTKLPGELTPPAGQLGCFLEALLPHGVRSVVHSRGTRGSLPRLVYYYEVEVQQASGGEEGAGGGAGGGAGCCSEANAAGAAAAAAAAAAEQRALAAAPSLAPLLSVRSGLAGGGGGVGCLSLLDNFGVERNLSPSVVGEEVEEEGAPVGLQLGGCGSISSCSIGSSSGEQGGLVIPKCIRRVWGGGGVTPALRRCAREGGGGGEEGVAEGSERDGAGEGEEEGGQQQLVGSADGAVELEEVLCSPRAR